MEEVGDSQTERMTIIKCSFYDNSENLSLSLIHQFVFISIYFYFLLTIFVKNGIQTDSWKKKKLMDKQAMNEDLDRQAFDISIIFTLTWPFLREWMESEVYHHLLNPFFSLRHFYFLHFPNWVYLSWEVNCQTIQSFDNSPIGSIDDWVVWFPFNWWFPYCLWLFREIILLLLFLLPTLNWKKANNPLISSSLPHLFSHKDDKREERDFLQSFFQKIWEKACWLLLYLSSSLPIKNLTTFLTHSHIIFMVILSSWIFKTKRLTKRLSFF